MKFSWSISAFLPFATLPIAVHALPSSSPTESRHPTNVPTNVPTISAFPLDVQVQSLTLTKSAHPSVNPTTVVFQLHFIFGSPTDRPTLSNVPSNEPSSKPSTTVHPIRLRSHRLFLRFHCNQLLLRQVIQR